MERRVSGKWRGLVSCSSFNSCSASSLREIRRAIFARANSVRPCINPTWETESFASPPFFLSLPPIFSRKTFPSSANIFFFFCKRLEKKPRYLKDKRERERSFPGARRVHHNRRLSIIARRRGKRGNVEWHPIEARAVARRSLSLRDSRALELIRVPWHTSGQIKFRF